MTLAQRITDLTTRIATEFKTVKNKLSGNNSGDITSLNTTDKSSLLAAINEANTAQANKIPLSAIGAANGVAPLDGNSLISSTYLPAYVDDILEFANLAAFSATGDTGKIYVALDTSRQYRWGGSSYTAIVAGTVDSVFGRTGVISAQAGDYTASQINNSSSVSGTTVEDALETLAGALPASAVLYSSQTLSAPEQAQARTNINAYGAVELGDPDTNLVTIFEAALL